MHHSSPWRWAWKFGELEWQQRRKEDKEGGEQGEGLEEGGKGVLMGREVTGRYLEKSNSTQSSWPRWAPLSAIHQSQHLSS